MKRNSKKILMGLGLAAVLIVGWMQFSSRAEERRIDCSIVRCLPCPEGFMLSPSNGNCCRCVKAH